jgi:hypothetical protein
VTGAPSRNLTRDGYTGQVGHCLERGRLAPLGAGVKVHCHRFNQRGAVGPLQVLEFGIAAGLPALQDHRHGAVQPAGKLGEVAEHPFGQQKALPPLGHAPEPDPAPLVPPVNHRPPLEAGPVVAMPLHDSEQLLSQSFYHQRGLHGCYSGEGCLSG